MKKRVLGTNTLGYPEIRNFAGHSFERYILKKQQDLVKFPAYAYYKIKKVTHPYLNTLYFDAGLHRCDLHHFFNTINIGNKPWVTTFEHYLPRGVHRCLQLPKEKRYINYVLKRLAHKSCKKLLPISEFAYQSQVNFLAEYGECHEAIAGKMEILHPPQALVIGDMAEKQTDDQTLTCTFVGNHFFHKGGRIILEVFDRLLRKKRPIRLNVISNIHYGDFATKSTLEDQVWAKAMMETHPEIKWLQGIDNADVLKIFRDSDIGLLPSYDETYGYSVLEAQAAGCPVISTNGAALSEINDNDCGWLIEVPLVEDNRSIPRSAEAKQRFCQLVHEGLEAHLEWALNNRDAVRAKGQKAWLRVKKEHDPESHRRRLEEIYDETLT